MKQWLNNASIRNVLAVMVILLSFIAIFVVLRYPVPGENKDLVNIAFGFVMGSGVSGVIGYYFGSSKSPEPPK